MVSTNFNTFAGVYLVRWPDLDHVGIFFATDIEHLADQAKDMWVVEGATYKPAPATLAECELAVISKHGWARL